jgi:hypothetical protein
LKSTGAKAVGCAARPANALFVTVGTLCKISIRACRSMNEAQPEAIQELYKMIGKFADRKIP